VLDGKHSSLRFVVALICSKLWSKWIHRWKLTTRGCLFAAHTYDTCSGRTWCEHGAREDVKPGNIDHENTHQKETPAPLKGWPRLKVRPTAVLVLLFASA
jgi:hypothetical protein